MGTKEVAHWFLFIIRLSLLALVFLILLPLCFSLPFRIPHAHFGWLALSIKGDRGLISALCFAFSFGHELLVLDIRHCRSLLLGLGPRHIILIFHQTNEKKRSKFTSKTFLSTSSLELSNVTV